MCIDPKSEGYLSQMQILEKIRRAKIRAAIENKCDQLKIIESHIKPGLAIGEVLLAARRELNEKEMFSSADTIKKLLELEGWDHV